MKKLIAIVFMIFLNSNVLAELPNTGTVSSLDLEYGHIVINRTRYEIDKSKTRLFSGNKYFDLGFLGEGTTINFELDGNLVTDIEYNPPIQPR